MKEYAIHPGFSLDMQFVSAHSLARLHKIAPNNYIVWDINRPKTYLGRRWKDYKHIFVTSYAGKNKNVDR